MSRTGMPLPHRCNAESYALRLYLRYLPSLVSQRHGRIYRRCSSRWYEARQTSGGDQQQDHTRKNQHIERTTLNPAREHAVQRNCQQYSR